jgi:hypothetical protein
MSEKSNPGPLTNVISLAVLGLILYACLGPEKTKSPAEIALARAKEADDRTAGFHCLTTWDGSHADFAYDVRSVMREPDSFEHIETRVTPVDDGGEHNIIMQYRARNGFGGMNVGEAIGTFRNSDCASTVISVE